MKVAQDLLRPADVQTTMNVYTGTVESDKREAAVLVAGRMLGSLQKDPTKPGAEQVN